MDFVNDVVGGLFPESPEGSQPTNAASPQSQPTSTPLPDVREPLTQELSELMVELFGLLAYGGEYFVREDLLEASNGWESSQWQWLQMELDGDAKVYMQEWLPFMEKKWSSYKQHGPEGLGQVLCKAIENIRTQRDFLRRLPASKRVGKQKGVIQKKLDAIKGSLLRRPPPGLTHANCERAFAIFDLVDLDGNGFITSTEADVMTGFGAEGWAEMKREKETEGTLEEFARWFRKFVREKDDNTEVTFMQAKMYRAAIKYAATQANGGPLTVAEKLGFSDKWEAEVYVET